MREDLELVDQITIAIVEMDNKVQEAYGGLPDSVFLIGSGRRVLYKEPWANPPVWPEMFEALVQHAEENGDEEQPTFGVGDNVGASGGRGDVPQRETGDDDDSDDDDDEGDGDDAPDGD